MGRRRLPQIAHKHIEKCNKQNVTLHKTVINARLISLIALIAFLIA